MCNFIIENLYQLNRKWQKEVWQKKSFAQSYNIFRKVFWSIVARTSSYLKTKRWKDIPNCCFILPSANFFKSFGKQTDLCSNCFNSSKLWTVCDLDTPSWYQIAPKSLSAWLSEPTFQHLTLLQTFLPWSELLLKQFWTFWLKWINNYNSISFV